MTPPEKIAAVLVNGSRFILMTHKDPDADGIGSMLALGRSLANAGKEAMLITQEPLTHPLNLLKGAQEIRGGVEPREGFDAALILDCAEKSRLGKFSEGLDRFRPVINIDHHVTNESFGDLNLVDEESSSTGELVFRLIERAGLPIDPEIAGNLFAAIQTDTGSFRYSNTTPEAMRTAADLMELGADPWEISSNVMDSYSLPRLRLLEMALGTVELHHGGDISTMVLSGEMFQKTGTLLSDSERFVDYPRFILGVELGVLIRETGKNDCKISLRSNRWLDVARLASRFGGGGHARAAGFEAHGSPEEVKRGFLAEAVRFWDGKQTKRNTPY